MSGPRDLARRLAPASARGWVRRLRKAAKGPPIFETELGAYRLDPDPSPTARLTLVLPSLSRAAAFGGVTTGLDIFRAVAAALRAELGGDGALDLRVATTDPGGAPTDPLLDPREGIEILPRRLKGAAMPTRRNEVFLAYNWHAAANLAPLLAAQAAHFGAARPLVYLVQEYEPGFFPFSADHLLIRWALEPGWPVHAVVNSSLLSDWLDRQGHAFERKHVFEPRLNPALRPFLPGPEAPPRAKRILVYGRPLENRNCWPILRRGLEIWAREHPEHAGWEVVSAGADHAPVRLAGGRRVRPVGKLSLEDYGRMLAGTAAGASLMASPHPSYPPLEMAHFGMRVISNRYGDKDLSRLHDNIVSLPDPRPETLARVLAETCAAFEADPGAGARGASRLPGYVDGDPFPPAGAIAAELAALLRR